MPRGIQLKPAELKAAFDDEAMRQQYPPVLNVQQVSGLLGLSPKTIYYWMAQGRLDGSCRKRGKHNLFWRDRVLELVFNGPEWR